MNPDTNNEAVHELLSALVDGELTRAQSEQVLDALMRDPALREQWRRHHLVSAVLSGHARPLHVTGDLAARVAAVLAGEPAPPRVARTPPRPRYVRAAVALAASVALVAVIAGLVGDPSGDPARSPPVRATAATGTLDAGLAAGGGTVTPAVREEAAVNRARRTRMTWNEARPAVEARLNAYLLNHNEYLAGGVRGMLPYARVVGYDTRD